MYNIFELIILVFIAIFGLGSIICIFYNKYKQERNIWDNFKNKG